ncbi:10065_t:CDS:2, partial [Cetraspora pellucida]
NQNNYLVENPVYFQNNFQDKILELTIFAAQIMSIPPTSAKSEENRLDQIIQTNTANFNETSLENTISNIEFGNMENNDDI